jgi:hypothetical protein
MRISERQCLGSYSRLQQQWTEVGMSTQHASDTKRNAFSEFFFAEEVPYGMAFVRMLLPMVLLLVMVPRWIHARELFSLDGAAAPLADNYGYFDFVPVPGGTLAVALATLLVATLVTSSLGWCTRLSLCVSLILYTYLNLLDCLSTLTKYSAIAAHVDTVAVELWSGLVC